MIPQTGLQLSISNRVFYHIVNERISSRRRAEVSRTRHSQSPSSDDEEGRTATSYAEESPVQGQVEKCFFVRE